MGSYLKTLGEIEDGRAQVKNAEIQARKADFLDEDSEEGIRVEAGRDKESSRLRRQIRPPLRRPGREYEEQQTQGSQRGMASQQILLRQEQSHGGRSRQITRGRVQRQSPQSKRMFERAARLVVHLAKSWSPKSLKSWWNF